jgi:hypothetical protein
MSTSDNMTTTTTVDESVAQVPLLMAIDRKFNTNYLEDGASDMIYSVTKGEGKYKDVYCVRLNRDHDAAKYCPLVRKKSKTHTTGRTSYWVNVRSGRVVCKCFSSKCKTRNGGRYTLVEAEDETSSEESDYKTSGDEDETAGAKTNKRRRI